MAGTQGGENAQMLDIAQLLLSRRTPGSRGVSPRNRHQPPLSRLFDTNQLEIRRGAESRLNKS